MAMQYLFRPLRACRFGPAVQAITRPWLGPRRAAGAFAFAATIAFALLCGSSPARSEDLPEYRLKAAFLYNFAAFTEWPAEVGSKLNLCVYGTDPFGAEIDALNGKSVGSRAIEVQRKPGPESIKGCHVVFVPPAAIGQLPRVLDAVRGLPVLLIADSPGAIQQGVALNMNVTENRVSFEVNLAAARGARLTLSSKLLRLATEVIK